MDAFGINSPPGALYYCAEIGSRIFTIEGVSKGTIDLEDGGENWLMKSKETNAY